MPEKLSWKAAISAGLIAGLVFMMLEMILVATIGGKSPWGPPRMIAAMVMGQGVLPPPATFDFGTMMVAMTVHFMMSIVLGVILGWIISHWRLGLGASLIAGVIFGPLVYYVDFYLMTGIFPWFAMARGGIPLFSHTMFGLVLAWVYHAIAHRGAAQHREA